MATDVKSLVDADNGLLSRRIFIEQDIYEQELENIFARCWLFLCHESQVPSPGDLIAARPNDVTTPPVPELLAYEEDILPEVEKRLGRRRDIVKPTAGTTLPNFSMLLSVSRSFRVWQPRGPENTEVWSCIYVDKAAPLEAKEAFRLAGLRTLGPAGTFEQDDMDNWQECTQTAGA